MIYSVSNKLNDIKMGYNFITYSKFTEPAELKSYKLKNPPPIWASSQEATSDGSWALPSQLCRPRWIF